MRNRSFRLNLIIWLVICSLLSAFTAVADQYDPKTPDILKDSDLEALSAVLIDSESGAVLYEKNSHTRMYPASTTKVMTLLLAIETGWSFDTPIQIPHAASDVLGDSSLIPVYPGETMTFGDLLYGMMLHSGNDGANAVAALISGSVEGFVVRMNERAAELGCTNTHFMNPHGYHNENHYTTALDLALIAQEALKHPEVRQITSTLSYTMHISSRGEVALHNKNQMLQSTSKFYYERCFGIKTGFHSNAGQCFIGAAEKDGATLISVVLRSTAEGKWTDTKRLFNYGFTRYTPYTLEQMFNYTSDRLTTARVGNASKRDPLGGILDLRIVNVSDPTYERLIPSGNPDAREQALNDFTLRSRISITDDLVAPITAGEVIGSFLYTAQDGQEITATLVSARSIEAEPEQDTILDVVIPESYPVQQKNSLKWLLLILVIILLILFVLIAAYASMKRRRREKRRRELFEQRRRAYYRQKAAASSNTRKKTNRKAKDYDPYDDF